MQKRFAGYVTIGIIAAATATSGCYTRRAAPPPPPRPYAQQPPPAFPGFPGWGFLGFQLPPPVPALGVFRPVNVSALLGHMSSSPCRPHEMSPGNWIGFDCTPTSLGFISRAFQFQRTQQFSSSTANVPPMVDHRLNGMEGPVKNQGAVGTCTAVSLSSAMEQGLRKLRQTQNVSALHVWSNYGQPQMGEAGNSNIDKRLTTDSTWPYDPAQACKMMRRSYDSCGYAYDVEPNTASSDPQIQASKKTADSTGVFTLIGVEQLSSRDPNELAAVIAGGDDLWVAFNINEDAWTNRQMVQNVIQDYSVTSDVGHAVVLAGYRTVDGAKQFLIHNSWGTGWGEGGYAWISENMVASQLRYAYRVRVGDPANPGPGPAGGCPAGQAMDPVYGQCVAACPNGQAPTAGLCLPGIPGMGPGPGPAPQPNNSGCGAGQTRDMLSGQCVSACPNGGPPVGGLCLPQVQPGG